MAGDWIKVQTCTPDKPEVHLIAERLGIDPDAVTGKLIRIWCWADQQTVDGNARSVTKTLLDRVSGVTGFSEMLLQVGWLEESSSGFCFPNFDRHNGNSAKTRASVAKRVEKHRKAPSEPKQKCNAETVTSALPEKRREETTIYLPGPDIVVNERINTRRVIHAVGRWIDYLRDMDVKTGTTKAIELNSPQEQELWNMLALWRETPEAIELAISTAISGKWQNLRKPTATAKGKAVVNSSDDWIKALNAARSHPQDYETRLRLLGSELFEALKRTGTARVASASDFELKTLSASFTEHLKDLRNGTPVSN